MRTLDLETLEIFRTVVHAGGVVRAAAHLNRVPSNVTTRIKQLEDRLGVKLFRRHGRTRALTDAGTALLGHAERLLGMADEIEAAMRSTVLSVPLRIGSMESTAGCRLPVVLTRLHQQFPQMPIELQTGTTAAITQKLNEYALDAGFVGEPFDGAGLLFRPVFEEELVLVTQLHHPPVKTASDLQNPSLLAFSVGCSYRKRLEDWFALTGHRPTSVLELASYQAMIACAAAGAGCALVPAFLLDSLSAAQQVTRHRLPREIAVNRTHLIWKPSPSVAVESLLAALPWPPDDQ